MSEQNLAQENEALRSKVNVLEEELALANQQLEWFRKQIFGRKTEQTSVVMEKEFGVQLSMFGNNEEKSATKSAETITVPEHKRKKTVFLLKRNIMRSKIPSVRYAARKWWRSVMKRLMMSLYIHPPNSIFADISYINTSVPSAEKSPRKGTSHAILSVHPILTL